jgi:hypothetical protein
MSPSELSILNTSLRKNGKQPINEKVRQGMISVGTESTTLMRGLEPLKQGKPSLELTEDDEAQVRLLNDVAGYVRREIDRRIGDVYELWAARQSDKEATMGLRVGRPRNLDYDWAYDEVRKKNRSPESVYPEWLERIGDRATTLADPRDSFNKAIKHNRKKD